MCVACRYVNTFWVCPNGGKNCHYRHALPPGYMLKSQMKALLEEEAEKIAIEEEIENQVITELLYDFSVIHNSKYICIPIILYNCIILGSVTSSNHQARIHFPTLSS